MTVIRKVQYLRNRTNVKIRISLTALIAIILALALLLDIGERIFVPGGARGAAVLQNSVPVSTVSAASFAGLPSTIAKNSIVAAFGTELATGARAADTQPLPTTLLSTTVTVNGTPAPLFFVSPNQINYLIPANITDGPAEVEVTMTSASGDQIVSRGQMNIASASPAIFTASSSGTGAPAALTGRVNDSNQFVYDSTFPFGPDPLHPGQFLPAPIDAGTLDRPGFLVLFCTGALNAPAGSVKAVIGGMQVPVTPFPAPGFTGLDQINLPIPISLKNQGIVDLNIVANGVSSNTVNVNIAGSPAAGLNIASISGADGALAGQTITINGAGFSTTPSQNLVRFGSAQGQVIGATANQLTVIVPFNAESGQVLVQTPQGETRSTSLFHVRTSVSGIVQSTGTPTTPPAPLEGVAIRVVGKNVSVLTNPQGTFVIPDLSPGAEQIEFDGGTTGVDPPYPRVAIKIVIKPDRDNQFPQPISMQQIVGGSGAVSGGSSPAGAGQSPAIGAGVFAALKSKQLAPGDQGQANASQQPAALGLSAQVPGKSVVISHRGVTLEIPLGAAVRFPDGKSNGQVQLTVLEGSRLPGVKLPAGVYSSTIAQITPLGAEFSPGASLSFPNPDPVRLTAGAKVDLYRFDFQAGGFIKRGTATVSADRVSVVSDGRLVDLASFWLAAAPAGVTTVTGRVTDISGQSVVGVQVSVNGRSGITDQNGGFSLADVGTAGVSQVQAEAVLPRQWGTSPRGTSARTDVVAGGITNVGGIILGDTLQLGLVLSPFLINFEPNSQSVATDVTLTQPAPSGGLTVTLQSSNPRLVGVPANVTIPGGQNTASFKVTRVSGGVATIAARATVSGIALETIATATVPQPAPRLAGVTPAAAPAGAKITISGAGLMPVPHNNIIRFVRNGAIVATLDPAKNEIATDTTSARAALRVTVPDIAPGAVQIVAATIDGITGAISDTSAPINFTVGRADLNAPALANVFPAQGAPRDQISISGRGFSQVAAENSVIFRQGILESEARVVKAAAEQLVVEVPSSKLSKGKAIIFVRRVLQTGGRGAQSNALDFSITSDPAPPPRPTLESVNVVGGSTRGRDGNPISVTGTGFGGNFLDVKTNSLANDEPLISMLLFYQNNRLINFALPTSASGGRQITSVIPTGLSEGLVQITTVTFDRESGLVSDESNVFDKFTIIAGSLLRIDEDEPNDSPELATKVSLQSIVAGRAAKDDPAELFIMFDDGTEEALVDIFLLSVGAATPVTFTLTMAETADLDLFVFRVTPDGEFEVLDLSLNERPGATEQISAIAPAGNYYIGVGAFSGSAPYALELRQGVGSSVGLIPSNPVKTRRLSSVERKKE